MTKSKLKIRPVRAEDAARLEGIGTEMYNFSAVVQRGGAGEHDYDRAASKQEFICEVEQTEAR
jgi:hypothetical protein